MVRRLRSVRNGSERLSGNERRVVEDIFNEIDGDLRAERAAVRNKKLALGGLGALVVAGLALGGWQFMVHRDHARAEAVAAQYFAAQKDADTTPSVALGPYAPPTPEQVRARSEFAAIAAHAPEGFATLSRLREAALAWRANDHKAALALWDQIGNDRDADRDLRGLGTLLWVQHQVDDGDPGLLKARLRDIEGPNSTWRQLATETDALIDLRTGHVADARGKLFSVSQDPSAPSGEQNRASDLLNTLDSSKSGG